MPALPLHYVSTKIHELSSVAFVIFRGVDLVGEDLMSFLEGHLVHRSLSSIILVASSVYRVTTVREYTKGASGGYQS